MLPEQVGDNKGGEHGVRFPPPIQQMARSVVPGLIFVLTLVASMLDFPLGGGRLEHRWCFSYACRQIDYSLVIHKSRRT